jgi:hypothetical protein
MRLLGFFTLCRLHDGGAEIVELLDFGGGEGAIDADVVDFLAR